VMRGEKNMIPILTARSGRKKGPAQIPKRH
jgi:hypothetical protein